jgi:hypothetical protein
MNEFQIVAGTTPDKNILTYSQDGRKSIGELWTKYHQLVESGLFEQELIYTQTGKTLDDEDVTIPTFGYKSILPKGKAKSAFWILSGIHGEEPAGPNALADNITDIINLAKSKIAVVIAPLLNGIGYIRDDRFFDAHRGEGSSVSDSEHLLDKTNHPNNSYAKALGRWVLATAQTHSPFLLIDHHEDEIDHDLSTVDTNYSYSYSYGKDPEKIQNLSIMLTKILTDSGFPIWDNGETRFHEKIFHGFVLNKPDGSVDELLATLGIKAGFVIETTRDDTVPINLTSRIHAHADIIHLYPRLWQEINQ